MKSVVFKDISKQQSEKAQKRKRLLQLMNQYPDWASQKNKLIMQEIQELGQAIGNWSMDQSRPSNPSRLHRLQKASISI